jgi:hypothetical protein
VHGLDDLVEGEPGFEVLLGRVPHLGVDDTVGGEVLGALGGDPERGRRVCMTATVWAKVSRYRSSEPESAASRNQAPSLSGSVSGSWE